jgi:hypothetical protein
VGFIKGGGGGLLSAPLLLPFPFVGAATAERRGKDVLRTMVNFGGLTTTVAVLPFVGVHTFCELFLSGCNQSKHLTHHIYLQH